MKPPTQLSQQDILQVAWLTTDINGGQKTLVLTIATQSWHPLGTRFAEEQQSFAEIGEVVFTESTTTIDIIKRWNGNLHWLPGLIAWYRQEDYARIDRYVGGSPIGDDFGQIECSIHAHDPVLAIKVERSENNLAAVANTLASAQIRTRSIRNHVASQFRYSPETVTVSSPVHVIDFSFPYLQQLHMQMPVIEQCAAWWITARKLNRS